MCPIANITVYAEKKKKWSTRQIHKCSEFTDDVDRDAVAIGMNEILKKFIYVT